MTEGIGRGTAIGAGLALLAGPALAIQEDGAQRSRQLQVFEQLLTETVQTNVEERVNATIERERRGDPDGDGQAEGIAFEPLVVKVGRSLAAHGIFVAGYGVMFTIQTPQVAVIPRGYETQIAATVTPFPRLRVSPEGLAVSGQATNFGIIEMRADMIQRNLEELQVMMTRDDEVAVIDADALEAFGQLQIVLDDIKAKVKLAEPHEDDAAGAPQHVVAPRSVRDQVAAGGTGRDGRGRRTRQYFLDVVRQQRSMKEVLERNHDQVANAMKEAAIETLAQYGSVIKGLRNDERISVVIMPPNPWSVALGHGVGIDDTEYVISVRYGDIRDYDNQKIDFAEFRERARIHDRLGVEMNLDQEEAR